jgi:ParB family chromosome partitioning protein
MVDLKQVADSRRPAYNFDPNKISPKPGFNARDFTLPENIEHVEQIAKSIRDNGYDSSKPIAIFTEGDTIYISDGECRWRAALLAEVPLVTCIPVASGLSEADLILGQNRANSAKPFTPLEEARNFAHARELGKSVEDIAKISGRSESHVRNWLKLHESPDDIKQLVADGKIAAKLAITAEPEAINEAVAAAGDERVKPKDVEPREKKPTPATAIGFIKKLGRRKDPTASEDWEQELRDFADIITEAKALGKTL